MEPNDFRSQYAKNLETNIKKDIKNRMEERYNSRSGRILGGIVLMVIGGLLLAHEIGAGIPDWIFTWPMIPVAIGIFLGAKVNFRPDGWLIPVIVGGGFLLNEIMPELQIRHFIWPTVIIVVGLFMIFRPKKRHWGEHWSMDAETQMDGDTIEVVSVFGGNKKMIITKNFKGGEAVSVFGGTELNLTQADINGTVTLELTQVFGGAKLIVPSNWKINSEVVSVFGALEDKRQLTGEPADNKVLKLIGTSVFGGVEIKSF